MPGPGPWLPAVSRAALSPPRLPPTLPPITNPGFSLRAKSAVVAIDTTTGKRHVLWAELDHSDSGEFGGGNFSGTRLPGTPPLYDPATCTRALLVRPAVNWTEGHRYI